MSYIRINYKEIILDEIAVCTKSLNGFINYYKKNKHESKAQQAITNY